MLAHVIQQLRDRRDRAVALAALTAVLETAGTTVVESTGSDGDSENVRVSSGRTRVGRFLSSPRRSGFPECGPPRSAVLVRSRSGSGGLLFKSERNRVQATTAPADCRFGSLVAPKWSPVRVCTMCTPWTSERVVPVPVWAGLRRFAGEWRIFNCWNPVRVPPRAQHIPSSEGFLL